MNLEKSPPLGIIPEDVFSVMATAGEVIHCAGVLLWEAVLPCPLHTILASLMSTMRI